MSPDQALRDAASRLAAAGVPEPMRDASVLLRHVVGRSPILFDVLPDDELARFEAALIRRERREPVSHIIGKRAFWAHDFEVSADVLDPRPETETLIERALAGPFTRVLDLGTGSGCILLSLLAERSNAQGVGTDISQKALAVAQNNAEQLRVANRVSFTPSDWWQDVHGVFDLIVSNPPYIALDEMPTLSGDLQFEPRIALTDEGDGLSAYRAIAAGVLDHLVPGGRFLVEIGPTQAAAVTEILSAVGLEDVTVHPDLDGRDRVVGARKGT